MLPNLTVRSARVSDRKSLNELVKMIGLQCVMELPSGHVSIAVEQTLVAMQGDCVIGFVAWHQDEMQAAIVGLGVCDTHRRFGVATQLVNALTEHLREAGLRLLEVVVPGDRAGAMAVFESVGSGGWGAVLLVLLRLNIVCGDAEIEQTDLRDLL